MRSFGYIVIAVTLLLSAVAVWIYLHRDHAAQSPSRPNSPSPISLPPSPIPSSPVPPVSPSPVRSFVPAPVERVSAAMDEVIVKSLISQARVASLKGDAATTGALVKGLKHHRSASEKLLAAEIAAAPDPETKRHLENILIALSGEPK